MHDRPDSDRPDDLTTRAVENLIRAHYDDVNGRRLDRAAARFHPDARIEDVTGQVQSGPAGFSLLAHRWLTAFPDVVWQQEEVVIDGDRAVVLAKMIGTHAGEFFGLPAAGRHVEVEVSIVVRIEGGLVATERRIYDFTGLLVQTGVLKAKPVS